MQKSVDHKDSHYTLPALRACLIRLLRQALKPVAKEMSPLARLRFAYLTGVSGFSF
jgi:hypothetical protein